MTSGLFFVSAKPLALHPGAPATLAIKDLLRVDNRQLQVYDVMQHHSQSGPPGLALSLIDDLATMKKQAAHKLQSLPQLPRDMMDDESGSKGSSMEKTGSDKPRKEDTPEEDGSELPPELQPVLMDDNLPLLSEAE